MKVLKYTVSLAAFLLAACTGHTEDEAVLKVDKAEIFADGHDAASFTVDFMGEDVTAGSVITNVATGAVVDGNTFTTETPGTYRFTAVHEGYEALPITVTAREAVLTLSTDYYAEGDVRHFTFRATYGTLDLSADEGLSIVEQGGEPLERDTDGLFRVTTTGDEKKTFVGEWNGHTSEPIVAGPMKFFKRVGVLEFTGTWCNNCPDMAKYIKSAGMNLPDRIVMIAAHAFKNDPMATPYFETLANSLRAQNLPSSLLDLGKPIVGTEGTSASDMERRMRDIIENATDGCGLAIDVAEQGDNAVATVRLLSAEAMEYGIMAALVENGITGYTQTMAYGQPADPNYVHDHVLREVYQDNINGVPVGNVAAGSQVSREFTFNLNNYNRSNCHVVVFATSVKDGRTVVINAAECAVGESVDFKYEQL